MEDYSEHYNPYIAGRALRSDDDFFGREDIIRQVKMTLESKQNNMVVLYGQRRIGKTSILNKLERALTNPPFLVVNFDLLDKAKKPITELLSDLASECAKKAGIEFDNKESFLANPDTFHNVFLPALYKKLGENKKLVMLFDEFDVLDETDEKLPETAAANAFHKYIRQLNVTQFNIHFVFVVGRRMEELGSKFLSTFKEAKTIRVFVLEEKDAIALIRRGENEHVAYEQAAINQIIFYTRGHPYFIQLLCQEIFNRISPIENNKKQIITKKIVEDSLHSAIEKGEGQFVWIWKGLPPAEQIVFSAIAENTKSGEVLTDIGITEILEQAGIKGLAREFNIAPSKLVEWKMLEKTDKGYRFYFEILRTWVEENQKLNKVKEDLDKISPLAETLYQTAFSYYRQNNIELSLLRLQDALTDNPNHFRARLLHGKILFEKKEYLLAINELKEAYKFDEHETRELLVKVMLEYGSVLEAQDDVNSAERIYDEIIRDIYKNEKSALLRKKSILIKRGDKYKAAYEFLLAFEMYKSATSAEKVDELISGISTLALRFEADEEIDKAEQMYFTLTKIEPNEPKWELKTHGTHQLAKLLNDLNSIYENLSYVLSGVGDIEQAKELIKLAKLLYDDEKPARPIKKLDDLSQKIIAYERLVHEIEETKNFYEEGDISYASQKSKRLVQEYPKNRSVLDLSQKIDETRNLIENAERYYELGDNTAAKGPLKKALQNNPANKNAEDLLSAINKIESEVKDAIGFYKSGDLKSAEDVTSRILRIQSTNIEILNLQQKIKEITSTHKKAKAAYDQGNLKSAKLLVDEVLLKFPRHNESAQLKIEIDDLSLNLERAESAFKAKDYVRSQKYLDKALEIQPSNANARKLILDVEKNLNKMQQQNRWLPTAAIAAIISSCATLIIVVILLATSPSIAELFIPKPTATITTHTPPTSIALPTKTFAPPVAITEVTPVTTSPAATNDILGQLSTSKRFVFLPLSDVKRTDGSPVPAKTAVENLQLLPGYHVLAGIPLEFRYEIFTQNEGSPDYPQTLVLPASVQNSLAAYFLIQADWGYARYAGKQIGKIEFNFDNGQVFEYPLVMSVNLRDWKRGTAPEAITGITSTEIVYAWEGKAPDGHPGGMDLLKISIPAKYQFSKLTSIKLIDTSLETTGEINAGIRILSASIEIQDKTPGPWEYQVEQIPLSGTSLMWPLNTNDVLILTGGSFQYQSASCSGNGTQICVLVINSTKNGDIAIDNLVAKNNWIAVTRSVSPDEAVKSVTSDFWILPNCGSGCSYATVSVFTDGTLANTYKVMNPNP